MASPPTPFGQYKLLSRIAVGGMAELYRARAEGPGAPTDVVAIKRILPHLSSDPEFVDMLVDEAKIAGLLSHPNIVSVYDLGVAEGTCYIAMEYVHGPDLGRVLARCQEKGIALPIPHAVFIAMEVLAGLEYAHTRQVTPEGVAFALRVVHRDITPANILLSLQGEVKITDFGIAKASVKSRETLSGVVKGHFNYLSPEQTQGKAVDARTDVFALGICLYEMITGQTPFQQPRDSDTLLAIREGRYTPPRQVRAEIPFVLAAIVARALQPLPERRFGSAAEMREELSSFFQGAGFQVNAASLAGFVSTLFPELGPARPLAAQAPAAAPTPIPPSPPSPVELPEPIPPAPRAPLHPGEAKTLIRTPRGSTPSTGAAAGTRSASTGAAAGTRSAPTPAPASRSPGATPAPAIIPLAPTASASSAPTVPPVPAPSSGALPGGGLPRGGLPLRVAALALAPILLLLVASASFYAGTLFARPAKVEDAPLLRVDLPSDATLRVNGQATDAGAGLKLDANVLHRLRVEVPGSAPLDIPLTLEPGEARTLVVRTLAPLDR